MRDRPRLLAYMVLVEGEHPQAVTSYFDVTRMLIKKVVKRVPTQNLPLPQRQGLRERSKVMPFYAEIHNYEIQHKSG